jgi:stearoyl-CoA desaturase (delta-9 desaturase)
MTNHDSRYEHLNWPTTIVIAVFHSLAFAALFYFSWSAVAVAVFLYWLSLTFGIGMGYHRLLTHRGYTVPKPIEYFFAVCATLAMEGGPIFWVGTHRVHHKFSDQGGDPHSPRHGGGGWAHLWWMIFGESGHNATERMSKFAPDLARDPFYRWLNTWHLVPLAVIGVILFAIGGLPWLLWGVFLRVTLGLHATWAVNSITHMWGSRRFETRDDSRNNWLVALFTFGEGWHNNHHAHPVSARHGLTWYEVDLSYYQIRLLEMLGIARNVKVASASAALPDAQKRAA